MLSRFSVQRVRLRDGTGKWGYYMVLARNNGRDNESTLTESPFSLRSLKKDGQSYKVTIYPGWVRDILTAKSGKGIVFHMPKVGKKDDLASDPPPEFEMMEGDFLYCTYKTLKTGDVTEVNIAVSGEDKETIHYEPVDAEGNGGVEGDYWVKLGKLDETLGKVAWQRFQNSDIEHYHELPTFRNVGDGAGVMKDRKNIDDVYRVRRIKGLYGVAEKQEADRVTIDVDIANVGDGEQLVVTGEKGASLVGSESPIEVRSIRGAKPDDMSESEGSPQIRVVAAGGKEAASGKTLIVKGNGMKGSLVLLKCDDTEALRLEWSDGLVTSQGDLYGVLGDCDSSTYAPPPP